MNDEDGQRQADGQQSPRGLRRPVLPRSPRPPRRAGYVLLHEARIRYEIMGTGPPLVLIASDVLDSRIWDAQVAELAHRYQIVRYDLRGFGRSQRATGGYSHTQDLVELLRALNIHRTYVVGFQLGATIALELAVEYPQHVIALILASPTVRGYRPRALPPEARAFAQRVSEAGREPHQLWRAVAVTRVVREGDALATAKLAHRSVQRWRVRGIALWNALRLLAAYVRSPRMALESTQWLNPPAITRLHEVHAPALIVIGQDVPPAAHELAAELRRGIAGAEVEVIPGAGPLVPVEQPMEFNCLVEDFFSRFARDAYGDGNETR